MLLQDPQAFEGKVVTLVPRDNNLAVGIAQAGSRFQEPIHDKSGGGEEFPFAQEDGQGRTCRARRMHREQALLGAHRPVPQKLTAK